MADGGVVTLDQAQAMVGGGHVVSLEDVQKQIGAKPAGAQNIPSALADRSKFPFDQPSTTYGTILPFAKNEKTGDVSLAWPEIVRAPYRGMITGGERLAGLHPEQFGKPATPDETAAVSLFATPTLREGAPAAEAPTRLTKAEEEAVRKLAARIKRGESGGGAGVSDIYDKLIAARASGKPLSVADVGNRNVQKLAGSVARAPDATADYVQQAFLTRLAGAASRLTGDVSRYISSGPTMRQTVSQLSEDQKIASAPLYAEAFKPGSVAPLEKQFEGTFNELSRASKSASENLAKANQQLTAAAAKVARAGDDVYSASAALREQRAAVRQVSEAQAELTKLEAAKSHVLDRLRAAQDAEARGERGGIWSPYVARLLNNPDMKKGIAAGLRIQRNEADAENVPFNPTDYAVVGEDAAGDPIVGDVPNMRLLDAGKRGLDAMLETYRNKITGKLDLDETGRSLEMLRKSLVAELDKLNPDYAAARAAWAGPAQSKGAVAAGRAIFNRHPEDIAKYYGALSDSDQQFYKLGVADALRDAIAQKGVTAPAIRSLGRESYDSMMKDRIRPLFGSQEDFNKFIDAVTSERTILENRTRLLGNSATAERASDDSDYRAADAAVHGLRVAGHALSRDPVSALYGVLRMRTDLGMRNNPEMNMALAKLLFDPNLDLTSGPGLALLRRATTEARHPASLQEIMSELGGRASAVGRSPYAVIGPVEPGNGQP